MSSKDFMKNYSASIITGLISLVLFGVLIWTSRLYVEKIHNNEKEIRDLKKVALSHHDERQWETFMDQINNLISATQLKRDISDLEKNDSALREWSSGIDRIIYKTENKKSHAIKSEHYNKDVIGTKFYINSANEHHVCFNIKDELTIWDIRSETEIKGEIIKKRSNPKHPNVILIIYSGGNEFNFDGDGKGKALIKIIFEESSGRQNKCKTFEKTLEGIRLTRDS